MISTTSRRMTLAAVTAVAVGCGLLASTGAAAGGSTTPATGGATARPGPTVTVLARHADFPDDIAVQIRRKLDEGPTRVLNLRDPGHIVVARVELAPGAGFPWHYHPGPVIISVAEGDLVYQQSTDCREREYGPQEALVDPGDIIHTAWNDGDVPTVLYATFYDVPAGGAPTIPTNRQSGWCD
ncbi:cupin domain-containing protein [uncultured Serinicoccus sp.]|uniref:cupin domain-containing protein n=1 Tax=uncultured Serinicoccus sp. TaxID=735514 RepID=UPI00260DE81E|nr:cupin domain-containing protein [uncultured Serinicoccus sp.]